MIITLSLEEYILYLNEQALKLDHRNNIFVPPRGLVITVQCDKGITRLGIATGLGGIVEHTLPEGISFECLAIKKKKTKTLFEYIASLFS
mgnify:CR=1 FL=1